MRSYERHQLKQDRFAVTTKETLSWAADHQKKIINAVIVVGIILILAGGITWYLKHREQQASIALGDAISTYNAPIRPAGAPADNQMQSFASEAERAKAAEAQFRKVADQYGSSRSGQMARYFMGLTEKDQGNTSNAEQTLKQAAGSRDNGVSSLAKYALAGIYRSTNRPADAIKMYKELIDHPSDAVPKSTAQLELGEMYEGSQQTQDAVKIYDQIAKDDPKSLAAEIANAKKQAISKQ